MLASLEISVCPALRICFSVLGQLFFPGSLVTHNNTSSVSARVMSSKSHLRTRVLSFLLLPFSPLSTQSAERFTISSFLKYSWFPPISRLLCLHGSSNTSISERCPSAVPCTFSILSSAAPQLLRGTTEICWRCDAPAGNTVCLCKTKRFTTRRKTATNNVQGSGGSSSE